MLYDTLYALHAGAAPLLPLLLICCLSAPACHCRYRDATRLLPPPCFATLRLLLLSHDAIISRAMFDYLLLDAAVIIFRHDGYFALRVAGDDTPPAAMLPRMICDAVTRAMFMFVVTRARRGARCCAHFRRRTALLMLMPPLFSPILR